MQNPQRKHGSPRTAPRPFRPRLRLFTGDAADAADRRCDGLSPRMRLSEFADRFAVPVYLEAGGARRRNVAQYRETVELWKLYTGDPPLSAIDDAVCAGFKTALDRREWRGRPLSENTVRKHVTVIQKLVRLAGRRHEGNPQGQGLIDDTPFVPRPRKRRPKPEKGLALEQIDAWIDASAAARFPQVPGVKPADFWVSLIVFAYNTALRIDALLSVTWDMVDGSWLTIPGQLMKGGEDHEVFLTRHALYAAERIRTADARLFPFPHRYNRFDAIRREIVDASGRPDCRAWRPHALRASCLTWLMSQNLTVAKLHAGHSIPGVIAVDVTIDHYSHRRRLVPPVLKKLPQPAGAPQPPAAWDPSDPQMRLF